VRCAAICHYNPSVYMCLVFLIEWNLVMESNDSMTRFHSVRDTRHIYRRIVMTYGRSPHNSITNVYQQISTFRRNSFACGKPDLPPPYFRLFQWRPRAPYKLALRAAGPPRRSALVSWEDDYKIWIERITKNFNKVVSPARGRDISCISNFHGSPSGVTEVRKTRNKD
jgi:hypothetical protein